jgi:hypothetical protein
MLLAIALCFVGGVAVLDIGCANDASLWIPPYPDAELIAEDFDYLRPFGIGSTTQEYFTTDDFVTVNRWYTGQSRKALAEGGSRTIATMRKRILDEEDGTRIFLISSCPT